MTEIAPGNLYPSYSQHPADPAAAYVLCMYVCMKKTPRGNQIGFIFYILKKNIIFNLEPW